MDKLKKNESALALAYPTELERAFREQLFETEWGAQIQPQETAEYVNRRRKSSNQSFKDGFQAEQELYDAMWPHSRNTKPLVIVRGEAGSGKSTTLRFFFDYYLYYYDHFDMYGEFPKSDESDVYATRKRIETRSKMKVLRVNLHAGAVPERAHTDFLEKLRVEIEKQFPDIASEANCAMWDRKLRWGAPHHAKASKMFTTVAEYRINKIQSYVDDPVQFVREAVWYLSSRKDPNGKEQYLIYVLADNLDQVDPLGQEQIVIECLNWLGDRATVAGPATDFGNDVNKVAKVVLPLRPETLRSLQPRLDPCGQKEVVNIGELEFKTALAKRGVALKSAVRKSCKQLDRKIRRDDFRVYVAIPASIASKHAERVATTRDDETQHKPFRTTGVPEYTRPVIEDLCSGSMRRLLVCQYRLSRSRAIDEFLEERKSGKRKTLSNYMYIDALLTSDHEVYDTNDDENYIANVYNGPDGDDLSPHGMLVGVYLIQLLLAGSVPMSTIHKRLVAIGFLEDEIADTLRNYHTRRLFHYFQHATAADYEVVPERRIVLAHESLMTNAAYLDNMAQVTPPLSRRRESRRSVTITSGDRTKDLASRVETTLEFLGDLRNAEAEVACWGCRAKDLRTTWSSFQRSLEELRLPSAYFAAAKSYKRRLSEIREKPVLARRRYDSWLRHPVLQVRESDEILTAVRER